MINLNTEISFLKSKKSKKSKKSSFKSYTSNNSDVSNIETLAKLKKRLRKFLNDEGAEFRSSKQAEALQYVIQRKNDVIAVLPTRGGKSML